MAMSSGVISRASSGVTMCDKPSKVTAISAGVDVKSYRADIASDSAVE